MAAMSIIESSGEIQRQISELQKKLAVVQKSEQVDKQILGFMEQDTQLELSVQRKIENVVITSLTQVGKTARFITGYSAMKTGSVLTVYSCDNSKAQLVQFRERLDIALVDYYLVTDLSKKKICKEICGKLESGKNVLLLLLNNASQIGKLNGFVSKVTGLRKYLLLHDEGDTVNKTDVVEPKNLPVSQKVWNVNLDIVRGLALTGITRIWITATPENIYHIWDVVADKVVVLPKPVGYVGISEHYHWYDNSGSELRQELARIRGLRNGEVILYCSERFKVNQIEAAKSMSAKLQCMTLCFNGDGIVVFSKGGRIGVACTGISDCLVKIKERAIAEGLVVVGHRLMDRGISFVGADTNPLTATVMFYMGGASTYAVSLVQRFGRITGTSRPDLTRRALYCPTPVYNDYVVCLGNQEIVYSRLGSGSSIRELYRVSEGIKKLSRAIDRPSLGGVNSGYRADCLIGSRVGVEVSDGAWLPEKMKRLVSSWRRLENTTQIARLFRAMTLNAGMMKSAEVREYVQNEGAYYVLTGEHERGHNLVFRKEGEYHYIRDEAMEYYKSI
jgi:hypothetical protein